MTDKNLKSPDERLFAVGKDKTRDESNLSRNKPKPDGNRPKGEVSTDDDDEEAGEDE